MTSISPISAPFVPTIPKGVSAGTAAGQKASISADPTFLGLPRKLTQDEIDNMELRGADLRGVCFRGARLSQVKSGELEGTGLQTQSEDAVLQAAGS